LAYQAGDYYDLVFEVQQIFPPVTGPSQKVATKTLKTILDGVTQPLATSAQVSTLSSQVTALKGSVDSLTTYLYAAIAIAVVAAIIAIYALTKK
jgi:hypothetical protein